MDKNAEDYMRVALEEAAIAGELDEVPVGAVIVRDGEILARAHNLRETSQQSSAHAEFLAIQKASEVLGTWCLKDCDLYVTLEPCMMCTGNILLARMRTVYYGTKDPKGGMVDSLIDIRKIERLNHHPEIVSGVLQEECASILTSFFQEKRRIAKEKRKPIE